jgi:hypothetical protein
MSMTETDPTEQPAPPPKANVLSEVKYSLPEMLAELEAEKGATSFAMEKLDQSEIGKMFKVKKPTRAKPKS